jgi:hypothetical protein
MDFADEMWHNQADRGENNALAWDKASVVAIISVFCYNILLC